MSEINSALGKLDSDVLGFTLMHEHVSVGWPAMRLQYPELFDRAKELRTAVEFLVEAYQVGIRTIVDLTPIDIGREPLLIAQASSLSGVQVIVATGFYYGVPYHFLARPDAEMEQFFVREIVQGIGGTGVHAGVIKVATQPSMDAVNERVLTAAARAHRQTGVPICTHTFVGNRTGLDQQRIFAAQGVDLGRTVIGHSDDSDDIEYLDQIIQNGSYCGMDRIGIQSPRTSAERAEMIAKLVERGYADRLTLSHDFPCNFHWAPEGTLDSRPEWRLTHIPTQVIPMLKEYGVSDQAIHQMTHENPRTLFGRTMPY